MKVLLTGATGMVGSLILRHCLEHGEIAEVVSLVRRRSGVHHPKLTEVVVEDFMALDDLEQHFGDVNTVYYCLGVYTGAVDKQMFSRITVDYPDTLAKKILAASPDTRFCLLSGAGADRSGKSRFAFARDKGEIENRLSEMGLGAFHTFRPGYIYPVTPRPEPGLGYQVLRWLYPVIRLFGEGSSIKSTELALAMFRVGLSGHNLEVLENSDIAAVAKSE